MEVQAAILEIYLPDFAYRKAETLLSRRGNFSSAVVGIYPAIDGHVGIHAMPKNWPQLIQAMDADWMATDERFVDNRARLRNDDELSAQMFIFAAGVTRKQAYERAGRFRAPISPVNTVADLLESKHLQHARLLARNRASRLPASCDIRARPARMPKTPAEPRRAPLLGEHTSEILGELAGLRQREIVLLAASGVV